MKKTMILALVALLAATAHADDYGYFTVRNADGEATSFTAIGLKMTFADGKLLATQDGTTTALPIDALDAMYFANEATTSIQSVAATQDSRATVYTLSGVRVAEGRLDSMNLPKGVYIVNKNGVTTKMTVR